MPVVGLPLAAYRTAGGTLPCGHQLEEPQLLQGDRRAGLTPQHLWAIEHQGFLGRQREQGALRRGKAGGVKAPLVDGGDLPGSPIVPTVVFRSYDVVKDGPQLLPVHPQEYLGLGEALLNIEVIAMQGHTAIPIGRAREEGMGELLR